MSAGTKSSKVSEVNREKKKHHSAGSSRGSKRVVTVEDVTLNKGKIDSLRAGISSEEDGCGSGSGSGSDCDDDVGFQDSPSLRRMTVSDDEDEEQRHSARISRNNAIEYHMATTFASYHDPTLRLYLQQLVIREEVEWANQQQFILDQVAYVNSTSREGEEREVDGRTDTRIGGSAVVGEGARAVEADRGNVSGAGAGAEAGAGAGIAVESDVCGDGCDRNGSQIVS